MQVELAKSAGFCFGVNKAMETVLGKLEEKGNKNIYTLGPLIHNEEVVRDLEKKGVGIISMEELDEKSDGIVIIRSHGVAREVYELLDKKGYEVIDATCPFVLRIHKTVDEATAKGERVIIVGDPAHAEVQGIIGWCNSEPFVCENISDTNKIPFDTSEKVTVVSQTTFNLNKFKEIVEKIRDLGYDINVVNTICNATEERQRAARELASRADCMIVIGGQHSSNSRKLYDICKEECDNTLFIQTLDDLNLDLPKSVRLVGVTAGASTPNNIIEEVQNYVRNEF
ncbi:MAG: 4-hydroxy-3-methylbut-2-enyl diphosphate reductase [Lachnospiraceae bacterium]|nr:4-hydroxy-3-methylbut-2-enyl diphosphate reductase [Lachnospiraceae bacterium]